ncbi:hypothetical protein WJX81_001303 [Elliptochloris bilobata]|uniref:RRM domain-containing protein n=1 Tax=Elliptochloris bilobata TaxID=381761 RepID=A0AAW1QW13_9CHLO
MTSRVCIKGIPKQFTDERLREHFSVKGDVTDAKVVRCKDGTSRQFGFVGFRSVEEAEHAVKYFNRTFIGTARIAVEFAEKYGGGGLARPWSKYSEGSSAHRLVVAKEAAAAPEGARMGIREQRKLARKARAAPEEEDPQLAEFLRVMQPRRQAAIWANDDALQPAAAAIEETGRLFVRNLPYAATEADLVEAFGEHGELEEVHLVVDKATRKSRGIALVQFVEPADAAAAAAALDGAIFQGRLLHVLPARAPPAKAAAKGGDQNGAGEAADDAAGASQAAGGGGGDPKPTGFKAAREAARRADAGNRAAWNTLFMRPDTVAAAVAAHYGVSKAELLDRDAEDLPARMALGEVHVVALTKRALGEAGADVAALEAAAAAGGSAAASAAVPRSATALLAKNLPYAVTEAELAELFGACGPLARLVLPPTRALALVEFEDAADARRAFRALAYKRLHHVPLYLEWAPAGVFAAAPPAAGVRVSVKDRDGGAAPTLAAAGKEEEEEGRTAAAAAAAADAARDGGGDGDDDVAAAGESATIYVKNLAFGTARGALAAHFDAAVSGAGGRVRSARVSTRKGADGKELSAGFGFVECSSEEVAKAALRQMQGSVLDGHKLVLRLSMRKDGAAADPAKAAAKAPGKGTKLVVRNVAFEATRKDIVALFGPFGQVKSCRLPKKFDGSHRGFAFVDFLTKQEAAAAAAAVAGTHLYGRRLVVEWAAAEEGLDELRAKTAARSRADDDDAPAPAAKRKKGSA